MLIDMNGITLIFICMCKHHTYKEWRIMKVGIMDETQKAQRFQFHWSFCWLQEEEGKERHGRGILITGLEIWLQFQMILFIYGGLEGLSLL